MPWWGWLLVSVGGAGTITGFGLFFWFIREIAKGFSW